MWSYVRRNTASIFRIYALYEPLRVFLAAAILTALAGAFLWIRFGVFVIQGETDGHVQSLILGSTLFIVAVQFAALGVLGDILAGSRVLQQRILERVRRVELHLGVEPSHYEPGAPESGRAPTTGAAVRTRHGQDRGPGGAQAVTGTTTPAEVPTGNTFDKYGSSNPVVKRLMAGFHASLDELWAKADAGVGARRGLRRGRADRRVGGAARRSARSSGIDLDDPKLRAEWDKRARHNLEFRAEEATHLTFADDEFDMAAAIEVLEHVPEPEATLAEMARVARRHLLVSVPREPLWRGLNMGRGAYLRDLGNTPGHVNHWSKRAFVSLLSRYGTVEEARSPFPWTMLLVRTGS